MTKTAAYNANEVAAVYMSLNRDDLLSSDEGGSKLSSESSLKNGFYGMSDPFSLRGLLESFEADFDRGGNKSNYRVRILNPTTELETLLIGFYNKVFPSTGSVFDTFKTASERDARMNSVEEATGDRDERFLSNATVPFMPVIYLRFGYGTNADSGLSRIHKAQLNDLKYIVSDRKDKVIELHCVDLFTYAKENPHFNKRPYVARTSVSDNALGQVSLKKPSEILSDVFASYMSVYPQCVPVIDFGVYLDDINNIVYSVAASLAESDEVSKKTKASGGSSASASPEITLEVITPDLIQQIDDLLDRPLATEKAIDRGVKGTITPQVLYQAYKMVFEQIGLKWELNSVNTPAPITGPLSEEQISPFNTAVGSSAADNASQQLNNATTKTVFEQQVNIQTELLHPKVLSEFTELPDRFGLWDNVNMLSFWPMALENLDRAPMPGQFAHQVLGNISFIEPYGDLEVTNSWGGVAPNDCGTFNTGPPPINGCGTQNVPPTPGRSKSTKQGLVIEFTEDIGTITGKQNPITRSYFNDSSTRFNQQGSVTPVNWEFNESENLYHTPQWYSPGNRTPSVQNNIPIKVKIVNVQGTVELNEREFYLYQADSDGNNGSRFFLVETETGIDGSQDIDWFNKSGNEPLSPYEQGGQVWIAGADLESPPVGNVHRVIRPLTTEEKKTSRTKGIAPIWVDAGMVNPEKYTVNNSDRNFTKYQFTLQELNQKVSVSEMQLAEKNFNTFPDESSTIKPVPVSIPVVTVDNQDTSVFTGPQDSTYDPLIEYQVPLIDLEAMDLYKVAGFPKLPPGEFHSWADYASGVITSSEDVEFEDSFIPALADSPPLLNLEPTIETAKWISYCAQNYGSIIEELQDNYDKIAVWDAISAGILPPVSSLQWAPLRPEFRVGLDKYTDAYVSMGDDGEHPHISHFLQTIINNINRLVIGRSSKIIVQPVQVNMLSEEDRKVISEKSKALLGFEWDEKWVENNHVLLLLGTSDDIRGEYTDSTIRPIQSFPQTFDVSTGNAAVWLDYGTPNSIVAKVDFTGDTRVLVNLAQSNYSVRQFNDLKKLFDGTNSLSRDMITNAISKILADKIAALVDTGSTGSQLESEQAEILVLMDLKNTTQSEAGRIREGNSLAEIDAELLDIFPTLIDSYQTDEQLAAVVPENSVKEMRVLASVISNPTNLNWLFPDAEIDGNNNIIRNEVIVVSQEKGVRKEIVETKILRRRVDFDSIRNRISEKGAMDKMSDVAYNFQAAIAQQTFNLQLTTLGIPEIDDPASEYLSRLVFFRFYDPRLASGQLHWLSGIYRIQGFKHRLNPSQGFLTQLNLYKDPKYNITNIRGMQ